MKRYLAYILVVIGIVFLLGEHANAASRAGGGFSGSRGMASHPSFGKAPSQPIKAAPQGAYRAPVAPPKPAVKQSTTTVTRNTTINRSYNYGGMGMGYGFSNGLLTGIIIGNMLHPANSVMYSGPGAYSNNAVLYPDGRVVNQQGYVVGNYVNGVFTPVNNGALAAQPAPTDAFVPQQTQPIVINQSPSVGEMIFVAILFWAVLLFLVAFFIGV
jgi:hypothetical protein